MSYHTAHRPYTAAVVKALDAAGIGVEGWFADANDPRDSCITLASTTGAPTETQTVIVWTEEAGWLIGSGPENELLSWTSPLDLDDVLPTPEQVVVATRAALTDTAPSRDKPGSFRAFEDENDGFEERLAAYAE